VFTANIQLPDEIVEIKSRMEEYTMMKEDHLRVMEGTVVAVLEDEILFVKQLNLAKEALKKTADEWLASDYMSDIYRLTGIGSDVNVGTEIRISFAIATASIPPLAPVLKYKIIAPIAEEDHLRTLEGTVIAVSEDEILFVKQLSLSKVALEKTADEWLASDHISDIYRLTGITSTVNVGTEMRVSFAISTMSIPPLVPVVEYVVLASVGDEDVITYSMSKK